MKLAGVPVNQNLITEVDKRSTIVKSIKFPQELSKEISDWAHNLSDKYSIWIADSLRKYLIELNVIDNEGNVTNAPKDENGKIDFNKRTEEVGKIRSFIRGITGDYNYVLDWLKGRNSLAPEHDQINFKTLTFGDAKKRSKEWHKKLEDIQGGQIQGEEGEVVLTFPDGFYWIKIGKDYCPKEAEAMGHCGRASGTVLYSLRREQYPYVTAAVRESDGVVTQMKGRANTKPKVQFHKYIIPFILGNNPVVKYFNSTYASDTDFNISDLTEVELKQVVDKKQSLLLGNGAEAIKKLSEQEIQKLLVADSSIIMNAIERIPLSDVLRTEHMVDWALDNAPKLFSAPKWGTVKFNEKQLYKAINTKETAILIGMHLDYMGLDESALNYIVTHKPEILEKSIATLERLSLEQKDYLVKNHPMAFRKYFENFGEDGRSVSSEKIIDLLGVKNLQKLFITNPELFGLLSINYAFFGQFLSFELLENYFKTHNKQNDPFNVLSSIKRLEQLKSFMNINTAYYLIKHYPKESYGASIATKANEEGGSIIGKYIVDHHFNWIEDYFLVGNNRFKIQDWNLSIAQKQKIVNSEASGDTTFLANYDAAEIEKMDFAPKQIQQLMNSENFTQNLTIDILKSFKLDPNIESTKEAIFSILSNDEDESRKVIDEISTMYGDEYVRSLYKTNPDAFIGLEYPVKYHDVDRLKKYNSPQVSYVEEGIKIRFDDWNDEDFLDFFEDSREGGRDLARQIANNELDFNGYDYDYKFGDIDNNFSDLSPINIARVRYIIGKAFPVKYKKSIKEMSVSGLVSVLNDPDSIDDAESVEYDDDMIEAIKDAFVRATEDAKRSADEGEYWNLYINPIKELLGGYKFANVKTQKKGEDIKEKQMLEFMISYEDFVGYIRDAEESGDYGNLIETKDYANNIVGIIGAALNQRDDKLEINTPYYGVSGDIENDYLNELFGDAIYENDEVSELLHKAKIVVKNNTSKKQ